MKYVDQVYTNINDLNNYTVASVRSLLESGKGHERKNSAACILE